MGPSVCAEFLSPPTPSATPIREAVERDGRGIYLDNLTRHAVYRARNHCLRLIGSFALFKPVEGGLVKERERGKR